jgi:hypothetical protein
MANQQPMVMAKYDIHRSYSGADPEFFKGGGAGSMGQFLVPPISR